MIALISSRFVYNKEVIPLTARQKRSVTTVFIVIHLIAIYSWAMPPASGSWNGPKRFIDGIFRPYLLFTGLWQGWDMFAPDPLRINTYLEADITFEDGSTARWKFPRMEHMGKFRAYYKERWRKWAADNVRLDRNSGLWPDAARYVARIHAKMPSPPKQVKLIRFWADVPPPERWSDPDKWNSYTFFTYEVTAKDLEGEVPAP